MSALRIQMDYAVCELYKAHFLQLSENARQLHQHMMHCVDQLQSGAWRGRGADAFYADMHSEILPAIGRLAQALAESSRAMAAIATCFQQAEREAGMLFVGVQGVTMRSHEDFGLSTALQCKPPRDDDPNEKKVSELRELIISSARHFNVPSSLVAAIIYDEMSEYDAITDRFLDQVAKFNLLDFLISDDRSLGIAQMQVRTVYELVERGYILKPAGWDGDKKRIAVEYLLDDRVAPMLVAARLRQIADHWQRKGVSISNRYDILATLYSIGLEGARGVHPNPEPSERGAKIARTLKRMAELVGSS
jgi:WXG100 family type VII secretion target